jgi:hypothetical protein
MADQSTGYTFLKWNGQYGSPAKFIVRDNSNGQQAVFTPGRTQDLVWTKADLSADPQIKDWQDFGNETVPELEPIAF